MRYILKITLYMKVFAQIEILIRICDVRLPRSGGIPYILKACVKSPSAGFVPQSAITDQDQEQDFSFNFNTIRITFYTQKKTFNFCLDPTDRRNIFFFQFSDIQNMDIHKNQRIFLVAVRLYTHQLYTRITLPKNSTPNDCTRGQLYTK